MIFVLLAKICFTLLIASLFLFFILDTILKGKVLGSKSSEERKDASEKRDILMQAMKWLLIFSLCIGIYITVVLMTTILFNQ